MRIEFDAFTGGLSRLNNCPVISEQWNNDYADPDRYDAG